MRQKQSAMRKDNSAHHRSVCYSALALKDVVIKNWLRALLLVLSACCLQIANAQSKLNQQLDSIDNIIESDNFDENYEPVLNFLETIKDQGLKSKDLLTKTRFLNYYAASLYFSGKYKECIPYLKLYTKYVEENGWGEMSCEWLSAYQSMSDAYYQLGEYDEAESSIRHAILRYENLLDSCPAGFQCYETLANIEAAKKDSSLLNDIHHQTQQCFYNYIVIDDPSEYNKNLKNTFENLSQIVEDALSINDMDKYYQYREYRANFLRNSGWLEEAEFEHKKLISDMLKSKTKNTNIVQDAYLGLFITYNKENSVDKVKKELPNVATYFSNYKDEQSNLSYSCILNQAAMTYERSGDSLTAGKLYEEAISRCPVDSIKRTSSLNYAYMANRIGVKILFANEPEKALPYFDKALELTDNNKVRGIVMHNIGRANMLKGNYKTALQYLKDSSNLQKSTSGKVMEKTELYIKECKDRIQ